MFSGWKYYLTYHLYYFTPETFQKIIEVAGFKIIRISTFQEVQIWPVTIFRSIVKRINSGRLTTGEYYRKRNRQHKVFLHVWNLVSVVLGYVLMPINLLQIYIMQGDELVIIAQPISSSANLIMDNK